MLSPKRRKLNRLQNYDYSQNGYYFVTICTKGKIEHFGKIENGKMILSKIGESVRQCWIEIPKHFPDALLDEYVIMPNHAHGVIVIENNNCAVGNNNYCSLQWQTKLSRSLSSIIRGFKIGVIKYCRQNNYDSFAWQKSFYDHVIRDEKSLNKIREYIADNPQKWDLDRNNQENLYM